MVNRWVLNLMLGFCALIAAPASRAEEAVRIGSAYALLNTAPNARGSLVLIPGGDGKLGIQPDASFDRLKYNQLVRTRTHYARYGLTTLTVDRAVDISAAVAFAAGIAKPVFVVATSRGSLRVPRALAEKPAGLVLTASFLDDVRGAIGNADTLPPTLVLHHRLDGCPHTPPTAVAPFETWGGSRVTVKWFDGGENTGDPCQARAHHGFDGLDSQVVAAIAAFVLAPMPSKASTAPRP